MSDISSWTLRDVTRKYQKSLGWEFYVYPRDNGAGWWWCCCGVRPYSHNQVEIIIHFSDCVSEFCIPIDRLISRYGSRAIVRDCLEDIRNLAEKREQHKTGSDEVAPTSDSPSDESGLHGGNGNSGEVDHVAETSNQEEGRRPQAQAEGKNAAADDVSDAPSRAEDTSQSADPTVVDHLGNRDSDSVPHDEDTPADSSDGDSSSCSENSNHHTGEGDILRRAEPDISVDTPDHITDDPGSAARSGIFGGDHLARPPRPCKHARAITRELGRVLGVGATIGYGDDPCSRYHGSKFISEMVSRRWALHRTRRTIEKKPAYLLVDVSGSCSSFCTELWDAATEIAKKEGGVIVGDKLPQSWDAPFHAMVHSNGARIDEDADISVLTNAPTGVVLALGDSDAYPLYRILAEHHKVIWLDNFRASRSHVKREHDKYLIRYSGVGGPESIIAALKQLPPA